MPSYLSLKTVLFKKHLIIPGESADKMFQWAWEHGGAQGPTEVEMWLLDAMDLVTASNNN